jgi:O-antigen/teichoic acid export membrane protein
LSVVLSIIPVITYIGLSILAYKKKFKELRPSIRAIDLSLAKSLFSFGSKFLLLQLSSIVIFTTSEFLVLQYFGPAQVVTYNIALKYFQIPVLLFTLILSPVWSAVTDAHSRKDYLWLKASLRRLNFISVILMAMVVILYFSFEELMNLWIKQKLVVSENLKLFMAVYAILTLFNAPYSNYINGLGKLALSARLTVLGVAIYFCSISVLNNFFRDSSGIILSVMMASLIFSIVQPLQVYKILDERQLGIWNK